MTRSWLGNGADVSDALPGIAPYLWQSRVLSVVGHGNGIASQKCESPHVDDLSRWRMLELSWEFDGSTAMGVWLSMNRRKESRFVELTVARTRP